MLIRRLASGLLLVTVTGEDREAGILGETGISVREIAEDEDGAVVRFDAAGMKTIRTEAGVCIFAVGICGRGH